jgi:acetyl esterase/lipase
MSEQMGGDISGIKETDHHVPMRDGTKINVRTHHPENPPSAGSPLAMMFHGGGWCKFADCESRSGVQQALMSGLIGIGGLEN